ncbi:MAG: serine hydrolase [Acidobacteria bacterium]|nr:MAG: serine hydrolase [Acidobacteriota bacterium]PYY21163.1 MAG: serine hydrolase [Acidobacteriota bacterium]
MRTLFAFLALVLSSHYTFAAVDTALQAKIEALAAQHHGKLTLYASNLKTGATVAIESDKPVATASVIKLPILVEAMGQVKAGKRRLSEKITLQKDDIVQGSGILQFFDIPLVITLKDALTFMIVESDNTATNLVMDQIGMKNVNDRIASMGLKDTYLYKKVFKPTVGPMPADQKRFGLGKTTAKEMAKVMESIVRCDLKDQELCDDMLYMLRNQQYRNLVPHYIETSDTSEGLSLIANKTGSLDEVRNDVAVVYSKNGPILISAFTYDNQDKSWNNENAAELLIAHIAKLILETWSPLGLAKEIPPATSAP